MQARIRIYNDYVLGEEAVTELLQLAYDTMIHLQRKGHHGELADGMFISSLKQIEYGNDPVGEGRGCPCALGHPHPPPPVAGQPRLLEDQQ